MLRLTTRLGFALLAGSQLFAQTEWRGGGYENEFHDEMNWTRGVPTLEMRGSIGPGKEVTITRRVVQGISVLQTGGTVVHSKGSLRASEWLMDDGLFQSLVTQEYTLENGSRFTINGGMLIVEGKLRLGVSEVATLRLNGGEVRIGEHLDLRQGSSMTITGGTLQLGGNLTFFPGGANALTITGGSLEALQLSIGPLSRIIIGGDAEVVFLEPTVGGVGLSPQGNATIDFRASGPQASLTFKGGPSRPYRELWDTDRLLLHGQSKSDLNGLSFHDTQFMVHGPNNETLSIVPEPAAAGLFAFSCVALTLWRRWSPH